MLRGGRVLLCSFVWTLTNPRLRMGWEMLRGGRTLLCSFVWTLTNPRFSDGPS